MDPLTLLKYVYFNTKYITPVFKFVIFVLFSNAEEAGSGGSLARAVNREKVRVFSDGEVLPLR